MYAKWWLANEIVLLGGVCFLGRNLLSPQSLRRPICRSVCIQRSTCICSGSSRHSARYMWQQRRRGHERAAAPGLPLVHEPPPDDAPPLQRDRSFSKSMRNVAHSFRRAFRPISWRRPVVAPQPAAAPVGSVDDGSTHSALRYHHHALVPSVHAAVVATPVPDAPSPPACCCCCSGGGSGTALEPTLPAAALQPAARGGAVALATSSTVMAAPAAGGPGLGSAQPLATTPADGGNSSSTRR